MWRYLKYSVGFWWGFGWTVAGILIVLVAVYTWRQYLQSSDNFYSAAGTITEKGHHGRDRTPELYVGYAARDGKTHETRVNVARAEYDEYPLGGEVRLLVNGVDPDDAWLETDGPRTSAIPWIVTLFSLVFIVPGPIVFAKSFTTAARRARVFANGMPLTGKVVAIEDSSLSINKVRYRVYRVRWTGKGGREHEQRSLPFPPDMAAYDPGDDIPVRVDRADPSLGEPDPQPRSISS